MAPGFPDDDLQRKKNEYASLPDIWPVNNLSLTQKPTVEREDAAWISERIYEDVDRGLISADLSATPATQCILLTIAIAVLAHVATPYVQKGLNILVKDIKRHLNRSVREQEPYQ
jgi:hypothetical protein